MRTVRTGRTRENQRLDETFRQLTDYSERKHVRIDASFFEEIKNYSRHDFVKDLTSQELTIALVAIGQYAINRSEELAGAGAVRAIISEWCSDPFSTCGLAARHALKIAVAQEV